MFNVKRLWKHTFVPALVIALIIFTVFRTIDPEKADSAGEFFQHAESTTKTVQISGEESLYVRQEYVEKETNVTTQYLARFVETIYIHLKDGDNAQTEPFTYPCPVKWNFTTDPAHAHYIVHSTLQGAPSEAPTVALWQKKVLFSLESAGYYSLVEDAKAHGYDLTMTYRLDSDIPIPYSYRPSDVWAPLDMAKKDSARVAAAFISNCGATNDRLNILQELQKYIPVDSYGACAHNHDAPNDALIGRENSKLEVLQTYLFTLVFENSNNDYYVTEKYYDALKAGTIPVFYGTGKFLKWFAIKSESVLIIENLADVPRVAQAMIRISQDLKEFEGLLGWKQTRDINPYFDWVLGLRANDERCRLAMNHWGILNNGFTELDRDHLLPVEEVTKEEM